MKDERQRLDRPRARRDAAKMLGVALSTRYRRFLESAGDEDAMKRHGELIANGSSEGEGS